MFYMIFLQYSCVCVLDLHLTNPPILICLLLNHIINIYRRPPGFYRCTWAGSVHCTTAFTEQASLSHSLATCPGLLPDSSYLFVHLLFNFILSTLCHLSSFVSVCLISQNSSSSALIVLYDKTNVHCLNCLKSSVGLVF